MQGIIGVNLVLDKMRQKRLRYLKHDLQRLETAAMKVVKETHVDRERERKWRIKEVLDKINSDMK